MNRGMILNLIQKDFRTYAQQIVSTSLLILLFGMLTIFLNSNTLGMFTSSSASLISLVVIIVFVPELQSPQAWIQTASLPVSRKGMVRARFLTAIIIVLGNLALWLVAFRALDTIFHPENPTVFGVNDILYTSMYILLNLSLYYLVFYRFHLIVVIGIHILPTILWTLISQGSTVLGDVIAAQPNLLLGWSVGIIGLFLLSFYSASTYFQKKNL